MILLVAAFMVMQLLPKNPGMSSFCAGLGTSCSPIIIGFLLQIMVNPDNVIPSIAVREGERQIKYFDREICDRLFMFFIVVGSYIIVAGIIGPYFLGDIFEKIKVADPLMDLEEVPVEVQPISRMRSRANSEIVSRKNSSLDEQLEMMLIDQTALEPEVDPSAPLDLNSTYELQAKQVVKS